MSHSLISDGDHLTGLSLVLAEPNDDIRGILLLPGEVVFKDLLGASSISSLGIKSGTRIVRNHSIPTSERILHGPPWVVFGCGLDIPDIARVTCEVPTLQGSGNSIGIANGTTSSVDEPECVMLK